MAVITGWDSFKCFNTFLTYSSSLLSFLTEILLMFFPWAKSEEYVNDPFLWILMNISTQTSLPEEVFDKPMWQDGADSCKCTQTQKNVTITFSLLKWFVIYEAVDDTKIWPQQTYSFFIYFIIASGMYPMKLLNKAFQNQNKVFACCLTCCGGHTIRSEDLWSSNSQCMLCAESNSPPVHASPETNTHIITTSHTWTAEQ